MSGSVTSNITSLHDRRRRLLQLPPHAIRPMRDRIGASGIYGLLVSLPGLCDRIRAIEATARTSSGSRLWHEGPGWDVLSVKGGSLDEPVDLALGHPHLDRAQAAGRRRFPTARRSSRASPTRPPATAETDLADTRKVIITCAVTGAIHTPSMSPHLPVTPEEIADAAIGAAEAGAAIVHLHARDPDDRPARPDARGASRRSCR